MMMYGAQRGANGIKILLVANVLVALLQRIPQIGDWITVWGALIPSRVFINAEIWRPVTYMFLHDTGGIWHLLFNMFGLWMFGVELEELWGTRRFVAFYFLCGIGSALLSFLMWNGFIIGASGAVYGVLTAYGFLFPDRQILLFFVFPLPARLAAVAFFLLSLLAGGGVAHWTHLGGIAVAFVYMKFYRPINEHLRAVSRFFEEQARRRRVERETRQDRYFEQVIDPILKKISEQGMNSLSSREKAQLHHASRTDQQRLKRRRILPMDLFGKGAR